jgi:hypothetical protein
MNIKTVLHPVAMERSAIAGGNDSTSGLPPLSLTLYFIPVPFAPHLSRMAKGMDGIYLFMIHSTTLSLAKNTHTKLNDRVITK